MQIMNSDQHTAIQKLAPLIKIIKDRESVYFEALSFASKNIESSYNDLDQIYIFSKFLAAAIDSEHPLLAQQEDLLANLTPHQQQPLHGFHISTHSKQMKRLLARLLEPIEASIQRAHKTLFSQNGKLAIDFARFKKDLHKVVRQEQVQLYEFASVFVGFSKTKYRKQIARLRSYLNRLEAGEQISLRDMYMGFEMSEDESSPQEKSKLRSLGKSTKRNLKQPPSQTDSPQKRPSNKKVSQAVSRPKRTLNSKNVKKEQQAEGSTPRNKKQKAVTAAQLLKYYGMMELNKKQFLEDYIFEKQTQEQQKKRIIGELMQKNKFNDEQIRTYQRQCEHFNPKIHLLPNPSSDEGPSVYRNQSAGSRMSLKTSFVISKRKPSFSFQSPSERSDAEFHRNEQLPFSRTIKNFSTHKRNIETNKNTSRPKARNHSKIFVVKSPMLFEDEVIPKAQTPQLQWVQAPLTGKDRGKKNEHIRLKKRNNPCPLDNNFLPESFQFTQYPL